VSADDLVRLEHARCEAISAGDLQTLETLLADDLTHTHANGKTETKAEYLAAIGGRLRTSSRGDDLRVRLYDDVAVMTGTLRNVFPGSGPGESPRVVELQALQVWVRHSSGWQQTAFASSGSV
jgi:hypothetical protein